MQSDQNLNVTYISNVWYMDWTFSFQTALFWYNLKKNWSYFFCQFCYICRKYSRDIDTVTSDTIFQKDEVQVSFLRSQDHNWLLNNSRFSLNMEELQSRLLIASITKSNRHLWICLSMKALRFFPLKDLKL